MDTTMEQTVEQTVDTTPGNAVALAVHPRLDEALAQYDALDALAPQIARQYTRALDGLYEAYRFGALLITVRNALDAIHDQLLQKTDVSGSLTCENAREITVGRNGNVLHEGGWNRGTGLKDWLATHCPEINYKTACRFLAVAQKTVSALALSEAEGGVDDGLPAPAGAGRGEAPCASAGVEGAAQAPSEPSLQASNLPNFPPEAKVREFLAGKSQRAVLRLGGARPGAGRKAKDWAAALEASPEVAWKEIEEPLGRLSRLIVRERRHAVLTPTDLHTLRDAIDLLHEVIHADA